MQNEPESDAPLAGRSVLVTGGTGFVGSRLVERLVASGARVTVLRRSAGGASDDGRFTVLRGDLLDPAAVRAAVGALRPNAVFHLAAVVNLERSLAVADACTRVNVLGTLALLRALEATPPAAFILASTTEVYGDGPVPFREDQVAMPPSPYAVSKVAAEQIVLMLHRRTGFPAIVARVATAYGPGQPRHRLIPAIIEAYARGESPQLADPAHGRDFLFVDDVVEGLIAAAACTAAQGEIINLGDDTTHTVRQIADTIRDLMGVDITQRYGSREVRANEARVWASSRDKAQRLLGWTPRTSLEAGLERTIAWFRADGQRVMPVC